eukprot:NODE_3449_length_2033_cov_8.548269.p1 GENE.NODE_3449_length_2033_cov_8.548269~~NODE_3449_length_2033_cov_8.548269.p1  ORF type:complete len:564 (-),score=73.91 NODE_3449_length_2033_cov_8.548269:248-1939(-)
MNAKTVDSQSDTVFRALSYTPWRHLKRRTIRVALMWAVPNACVAALLRALHDSLTPFLDNILNNNAVYTSYSFLVGILIVFRTSQCYGRFWEGTTLLFRLKADLLEACSSLVAFCQVSKLEPDVSEDFQHVLVQLFSMLHALMLMELKGQQDCDDIGFELVHGAGVLDLDSLEVLRRSKCKTQLVFQWVQHLCVHAVDIELLSLPAPIVTRAFQELAGCMAVFHNATVLTNVPFPFPYILSLEILLLLQWFVTPIILAIWTESPVVSAFAAFTQTFFLWTMFQVAEEMEHPFGDDEDDLDMPRLQNDLNIALEALMDPACRRLPHLTKHRIHAEHTQASHTGLMVVPSEAAEDNADHGGIGSLTRALHHLPRLSNMPGLAQHARVAEASATKDTVSKPHHFDLLGNCHTHVPQVAHLPEEDPRRKDAHRTSTECRGEEQDLERGLKDAEAAKSSRAGGCASHPPAILDAEDPQGAAKSPRPGGCASHQPEIQPMPADDLPGCAVGVGQSREEGESNHAAGHADRWVIGGHDPGQGDDQQNTVLLQQMRAVVEMDDGGSVVACV